MIKYPMFPLPYRFQTIVGVAYATREVVFESQNKQVQQLSINPIEDWQIDVAGDVDDYIKLHKFFKEVGGNARPFIFFDEANRPRLVRFSSNKLTITAKREWKHNNVTNGEIVGFTGNLSVETVIRKIEGVNPNDVYGSQYKEWWKVQLGDRYIDD